MHRRPRRRAPMSPSGQSRRFRDSDVCPVYPGGFNGSAQHLLILLDQEVSHGDITDMVHGDAEGRAVGALEGRVKCCSDLAGPGSEEQDGRSANCDAPWRNRAGVPPESFGSAAPATRESQQAHGCDRLALRQPLMRLIGRASRPSESVLCFCQEPHHLLQMADHLDPPDRSP